MTVSQIFGICQKMDRKMMTRFKEFADSPYHNKNKEIKLFVGYLSSLFPNFPTKMIETNKIVEAMGGPHQFDSTKLKYLFSNTLLLVDEFMAIEQMRAEIMQEKLLTLKKLRLSHLPERFERIMKEAKKINQSNPYRDSSYHLQEYYLNNQAYLEAINIEMYKATENLQEGMNNLDLFYMSEKLKNAAEMINRSQFFRTNYTLNMVNESLNHIEENISLYINIPAVYIYYNIYKTVQEPNKLDHYYNLLEYAKKHSSLLPPEDEKDVYLHLYNFCTRKINMGQEYFLNDGINIMKLLLEKELIIENNSLPEQHFKNIVALCIRAKEFDWVEDFIHNYKPYLPESNRENASNFCLASLYYAQNNYDMALSKLNEVGYTDIIYNLDAKSLLLRIYYDLNEDNSIQSLFFSVKQYLKRNDVLSEQKHHRYSALFNFALQLFKIKQTMPYQTKQKNEKDLQNIESKIENNSAVANLNWLKEKIKELRSSI